MVSKSVEVVLVVVDSVMSSVTVGVNESEIVDVTVLYIISMSLKCYAK